MTFASWENQPHNTSSQKQQGSSTEMCCVLHLASRNLKLANNKITNQASEFHCYCSYCTLTAVVNAYDRLLDRTDFLRN